MLSSFLKHFNHIWIALVLVCVAVLFFNPHLIARESISSLLNHMGTMALLVYVALSLSRALLMIPCTPFVLAGAISFPDNPLIVLLISLAGIVVGGLLVYSFPSFGNYGEYLEEKYPEKIANLKDKMHGKYAFWIVAGWSFFPLVPTDVICYVAGMVKMSYKRMVTALLFGELPLVTLYIYVGAEIGVWLRV